MKKTLQGINRDRDETEDKIRDLKDKGAENTQSEQQKEKRILKNGDSLRSLWDNFKCTNIHIFGVPEGEDRAQEIENLFEEKMTKNFPNLVKEKVLSVQEAQRPQTSWTHRGLHRDTS